jgi:hypothetical protein
MCRKHAGSPWFMPSMAHLAATLVALLAVSAHQQHKFTQALERTLTRTESLFLDPKVIAGMIEDNGKTVKSAQDAAAKGLAGVMAVATGALNKAQGAAAGAMNSAKDAVSGAAGNAKSAASTRSSAPPRASSGFPAPRPRRNTRAPISRMHFPRTLVHSHTDGHAASLSPNTRTRARAHIHRTQTSMYGCRICLMQVRWTRQILRKRQQRRPNPQQLRVRAPGAVANTQSVALVGGPPHFTIRIAI